MLSEINRSYPSLVLIFYFSLCLLPIAELNPKCQFGDLFSLLSILMEEKLTLGRETPSPLNADSQLTDIKILNSFF